MTGCNTVTQNKLVYTSPCRGHFHYENLYAKQQGTSGHKLRFHALSFNSQKLMVTAQINKGKTQFRRTILHPPAHPPKKWKRKTEKIK